MSAFQNWQHFLDTRVKSFSETQQLGHFKKLKSDVDRIRCITENAILGELPWLCKYFEDRRGESLPRKNESVAQELRKKGNSHFIKKHNEPALSCYNQCVCSAPENSEELALGLANRSAALFHMKNYAECVEDTKAAITYGHPQPFKLRLRQAKALGQLGNIEEASQVLETLLETEDWSSNADKSKKAYAKSECEEILADLKNMKLTVNSRLKRSKSIPSVMAGPNPVVTQASNAMELQISPSQGRHLVASSYIQSGAVLVVEKPYAAVLLPPHYSTHCQHCYTKLVIHVPCPMCSDVAFCSEECRDKATYHQLECRYLDLLESIGIAHLSLRIVLTTGLAYLKGFEKETRAKREIPGMTPDGQYTRSYFAVYDLMPHTDNLQPEDLLQYTLTASLLLELLRNTDFFHTSETGPESSDISQTEQYIGSLLLRHICQLVCNAHAITEVQRTGGADESVVDETEQVRIATAIYPTVSLMNHSCEPSIIASFDGNLLIVRAVKDIKKGEQIYNCYGPHAKRMEYQERQQHLQEQYFFHCHCKACQKQGKDDQRYRALLCPNCQGALPVQMEASSKCLDCGKTSPVSKIMKSMVETEQEFIRGILCVERNDKKGALKHFQACLKKREKILYKHNRQLAECQDAVAKCHVMMGHWKEAEKYLDASIATTEEIYGPASIEVANELRKLADVLFQIKPFTRLRDTIVRARDIFQQNYGYGHEDVMEMMEMLSKVP